MSCYVGNVSIFEFHCFLIYSHNIDHKMEVWIPCIFTGSKRVLGNSSLACLLFSSTLHLLEQMSLENQRSEQYGCSKGKHIYACLVIMVIWDMKSFFTFFFSCVKSRRAHPFVLNVPKHELPE